MVKDGAIDLSEAGITQEILREISQVYIVACGSAYHVGVVAQYVMEDLAGIPVRVELASEFRYRHMNLDPAGWWSSSASPERPPTVWRPARAKEAGLRTLAIVNVVGSSIAREADTLLYPGRSEIAVATTKPTAPS